MNPHPAQKENLEDLNRKAFKKLWLGKSIKKLRLGKSKERFKAWTE